MSEQSKTPEVILPEVKALLRKRCEKEHRKVLIWELKDNPSILKLFIAARYDDVTSDDYMYYDYDKDAIWVGHWFVPKNNTGTSEISSK